MKLILTLSCLLLLSQVFGLEAPNQDTQKLVDAYLEEVAELVNDGKNEAEKLRDELLESLSNDQAKQQKRGKINEMQAYDSFIHYFSPEEKADVGLFGESNGTHSKSKSPLLPDTSQLPTEGIKYIDMYIAGIKKIIADANKSSEKEKTKVIKKIQSQVKKLTKAKDLDGALDLQSFIKTFQAYSPIDEAFASLIPLKSFPGCQLYLSFNANSLRKHKKQFIAMDYSENAQTVPVPAGLKIEKGIKNEAIRFDENNAITVKTPAGLKEAKSITLCAWIWIEELPNKQQRTIISHTYRNWEMQIENKRLFVEGANSPTSKTIFENEKWYHIAWTQDHESNDSIVYVNGKMDGKRKVEQKVNIGNMDIVIGDRCGKSCGPWLGLIDEVMIFDRALDAKEIAALAKTN